MNTMKRTGGLLLTGAAVWLAAAQTTAGAETLSPKGSTQGQSRNLSVFTNGPWKGAHAVYTNAIFDAVMSANGRLDVYPKDKGVRIGRPLWMGLRCFYRTSTERYGERNMATFEGDTGPLMNPKMIQLRGKLDDDVDYSVTFMFEKNSISGKGFLNDPQGLKPPTAFRLGVSVLAYTNFPPDTPMAVRQDKLKGLSLVIREGGKKNFYPYAKGTTIPWRPEEKCWIEGPVYGPRKISFEVKSDDTAFMHTYIYSGMAPYEGYFVGMYYKSQAASKKSSDRFVLTIQ